MINIIYNLNKLYRLYKSLPDSSEIEVMGWLKATARFKISFEYHYV